MDYSSLVYVFDGSNHFQQLPYNPSDRNVYQQLQSPTIENQLRQTSQNNLNDWSDTLESSSLWDIGIHTPKAKTPPDLETDLKNGKSKDQSAGDKAKATSPKIEEQKKESNSLESHETLQNERAAFTEPSDEKNSRGNYIEMPEMRFNTDLSKKYHSVKTALDAATEAKKSNARELEQEYRKEAKEAYQREKEESDKVGVAALGVAMAAPFVASAAYAFAGEAVLAFMARRSVQWTLTSVSVATGVKSDEEADISSVVLEGALRGILPVIVKKGSGPGLYGRAADDVIAQADESKNLLDSLNNGDLGTGLRELDKLTKLWNPIAERMRTVAVIKTDKGLYYAVRGGPLDKEQIKILESFGMKPANKELMNLGLVEVAKEGHAERQLLDLTLAKGEKPQVLLISKAACGQTCHRCGWLINDGMREYGFTPNVFHPDGTAVTFRPTLK
ncbi:MAG: hypothetical protein ACK5OP_10185 [Sphingobacteriales bacterium]